MCHGSSHKIRECFEAVRTLEVGCEIMLIMCFGGRFVCILMEIAYCKVPLAAQTAKVPKSWSREIHILHCDKQ